MDFKTGGQAAIGRMIEAYGFTTRQALCEQLGVSKSTLATRYMRDIFPADFIIQCALETGVSLRWLAAGEGPMYINQESDIVKIDKMKLIEGKVYPANYFIFDKTFLPAELNNPLALVDGETTYIIQQNTNDMKDGLWLVDIEGKNSVKRITRIPVGRVRVSDNDISFDCALSEIKLIGRITLTVYKS
ncbi:phage repressor protein CI [Yersinia enterocolitica]|nr:phage repressor protein CI [Yersinia enterocolitica]